MLKFSLANGSPIWINPLHITHVTEGTHGAVLGTFSGGVLHLEDPVDEVVQKIEEQVIHATRPPLSAFA